MGMSITSQKNFSIMSTKVLILKVPLRNFICAEKLRKNYDIMSTQKYAEI